jgi:cysteine desulfurase
MDNKIYFDNASTTSLLPEVTQKMMEVLQHHYGNPSSIHAYGRKSRSLIEDARKKVAKSLNVSIGEIFFTSSATEANNTILKRSIIDLNVTHIVSSPTEHHCIIHTIDSIKTEFPHVKITMLDVDRHGRLNYDQLDNLLTHSEAKTLVSLMYGNNEIGTIHDMSLIAQICQRHGALYHCDAVQMVGKYTIDLQKSPLAFLTGTAHKFHGPKGSAFFYMNGDNIIHPFIYGGAQERNMRAGTENVAGIVGLAEALTTAMEKMQERYDYVSKLKTHFESGIYALGKDCFLNNPTDTPSMYHITSVSFADSPTVDMLMFNLDIAGIAASSGSACSAGIEEDSHVLLAIGHPAERKTIRFSFSSYNTLEEVNIVIDKLRTLLH